MTGQIERRLAELGVVLPPTGHVAGSYLPHMRMGNLVMCTRGPLWGSERRFRGKVGREISPEQAREAARLAALNVLAEVRAACGDLDHVRQVVRVAGFINCVPEFESLPPVLDGASSLFIDVFGEKGRHHRVIAGVASLPGQSTIHVEAWVEVE